VTDPVPDPVARATTIYDRAIAACNAAGTCSEPHYRAAIIREIATLLAEHERRVAELLAHNTAGVKRRRAVEAELAKWRDLFPSNPDGSPQTLDYALHYHRELYRRLREVEAERDRLRDRLRIPDAPPIDGNCRAYLDRDGRPWCWPTEYTIEWWNMTGSFENARQFRDTLAGVPEPSRRLNRALLARSEQRDTP